MSMFSKATRRKVKVNVAFTGPGGAGKTMSAILFARGLVGKKGRIAMIDTESGSGELYCDLTDFDHVNLQAPYTIEKLFRAIDAAVEEGFDAVIVDSFSHFWEGEGGLKDQKDKLDVRDPKGTWTNWAHITPQQNSLLAKILSSEVHIVGTIRSKEHYEATKDGRGKIKPVKTGLAPMQREGFTYEFTTVFDILQTTHEATVSKDRTGMWGDKVFKVTEKHGKAFADWLEKGTDGEATTVPQKAPEGKDKDGKVMTLNDVPDKVRDLFRSEKMSIENGLRLWADHLSKANGNKDNATESIRMATVPDVVRDIFRRREMPVADGLVMWDKTVADYKGDVNAAIKWLVGAENEAIKAEEKNKEAVTT